MMKEFKITIDGQEVMVQEGKTILEVLQKQALRYLLCVPCPNSDLLLVPAGYV